MAEFEQSKAFYHINSVIWCEKSSVHNSSVAKQSLFQVLLRQSNFTSSTWAALRILVLGKRSTKLLYKAWKNWFLIDLTIRQLGLSLFATSATKACWLQPFRFRALFQISYCVIQRLIQHCFLSKMVYLNVKYIIASRHYDILNTGTVDMLVKCNMHLQRQSRKSVVRPCSYCKLFPMFCANAFCKPASCTLPSTASILMYRITFFTVIQMYSSSSVLDFAMESTLSSISGIGSSGIQSSSLSSSLTLSLFTSFLYFVLANISLKSFSSSLGKTIGLRRDVEISDFQANNAYFQYYKLIHYSQNR